MKRAIVLALILLGALMYSIEATQAQGGGDPDHIGTWTLSSSSGGVMTGTGFSLVGTAGQPDTDAFGGTDNTGSGGIWPVGGVVIEPYPFTTEVPPPPIDEVPVGIPIDIQLPPIYALPPFPGLDGWGVPGGVVLPDWNNSIALPDSLNLPAPFSLTTPSFPSDLGLSPFPTLTVPSLPTSSVSSTPTGTGVFTGVTNAAELMSTGIISDIGISDPNLATLFGYTAMEMATEMVDGMATALMYARALRDINVIGPTVIAILIGLAYIALVLFIRMVIKALILVIDVIVRLWELLPFT